MTPVVSEDVVARLYRQARAGRWSVPVSLFGAALETSAAGRATGARDVERFLSSLHLEDLALACACASGNDDAWEHFIRELRPQLYRAADALDPSGGARELADALYADLYGLEERDGERRSLLRYFHGRSSLATWLRAVLAQRHVDRARAGRRFAPLEDDETRPAVQYAAPPADPDRERFQGMMQQALAHALARLPARDRLRLGCYYAQDLTLAQTGRVLAEHEATVSRQLARTRRVIREVVEQYLQIEGGLGPDDVARCFASTTEDAGALDLGRILDEAGERKIGERERSIGRESL
jgi:RNA polymerase sigma-70 factor, ECF subfamily